VRDPKRQGGARSPLRSAHARTTRRARPEGARSAWSGCSACAARPSGLHEERRIAGTTLKPGALFAQPKIRTRAG
jgi:hypothetical protein